MFLVLGGEQVHSSGDQAGAPAAAYVQFSWLVARLENGTQLPPVVLGAYVMPALQIRRAPSFLR